MSIINSQTYLNFSGSIEPERDENGNILSITSSDTPLNIYTQFFEVGSTLKYYSSSNINQIVDTEFRELITSNNELIPNIPEGAILISQSLLDEIEAYIFDLESQIIGYQTQIEDLNEITGSLNVLIDDLNNYINILLSDTGSGGGGGTPTEPPTIINTSLPDGRVDASYSATLSAINGITPYNWSIAIGKLPTGLSMSQTGAITGTPIKTDIKEVTFRVVDHIGNEGIKTLNIKINVKQSGGSPGGVKPPKIRPR